MFVRFLVFLISLIVLLFIFSLPKEQKTEKTMETSFVKKVLDGDTIELINGTKIRLYGINTPEKGYYLNKEAKEFLESILNEKIEIENLGMDKYNRTLGIIYLNKTNVNLLMVRNGLATVYMTEKEEFKEMEKEAKANSLGLWKKSGIVCIRIMDIKPKEEYVILKNNCFDAIQMNGWSLKDDGRKTIVINQTLCANCSLAIFSANGTNSTDEIYWGIGDVWNDEGDRAFLRDEKGLLVDVYDYK